MIALQATNPIDQGGNVSPPFSTPSYYKWGSFYFKVLSKDSVVKVYDNPRRWSSIDHSCYQTIFTLVEMGQAKEIDQEDFRKAYNRVRTFLNSKSIR